MENNFNSGFNMSVPDIGCIFVEVVQTQNEDEHNHNLECGYNGFAFCRSAYFLDGNRHKSSSKKRNYQ